MSMNSRYSTGLFAPSPAPGYPGGNFFGSVPTTATTASPGRNTGPTGSGVSGAVNGILPSSLSGHHALAIGVVVLGGFLIYWYARKE